MTSELEPRRLHFRKEIPRDHRSSLDTRLRWLWNQRFGTVQQVWKETPDVLDRTAATLVLQCILGGGDLESIVLLFRRLEGGPQVDEEVLEQETMRI